VSIAESPQVSQIELPISGCTVIVTERGTRHTLEILNPGGDLLGVVSDSLLDPAVVRAAWRGTRDGQPWALAAGRSVSVPVVATFAPHRSLRERPKVEVEAVHCGSFWVAEAAFVAARVSVTAAGEAAGSVALQPIS
jgi:hypothetical protein